MNSSIFNSNPLIQDLAGQRRQVVRLAAKIVLFLMVLFVLDRAVGFALRRGLDRYFGLDRPAKVLCVGHSHIVLGLDEEALQSRTGMPVAKYAVGGTTVYDRDAMIRHFLEKHPHDVEWIIYAVDSFTFTKEGLSSNSYQLFLPYADSPAMREHVERQAERKEQLLVPSLFHSARYNPTTIALAARGALNLRANLKHGQIDVEAFRRQVNPASDRAARTVAIEDAYREQLLRSIRYMRARGIKVVLLHLPTLGLLNDSHRDAFQAVNGVFEQMARGDAGVFFLDYNPQFEDSCELFFDEIHLNPDGRDLLTSAFIKDLEALLESNPTVGSTIPSSGRSAGVVSGDLHVSPTTERTIPPGRRQGA